MPIKIHNGWSNKSFDMLLELLKASFPMGTTILSSFYEAKQKLCDLGLGYETIYAYKYNCILYWKNLVICNIFQLVVSLDTRLVQTKGNFFA